MQQPTVSIVTPVYKVKDYIADCVQSVINQTYEKLEFILVDDCGGDNSIDIAESILKTASHPGFSYRIIHLEHNSGVSVARNTAMKAATGDYIFCLDSDDKLLPECISHLVEKAELTNADITLCDYTSGGNAQNRGGKLTASVKHITTNAECIHAFAKSWFNVAPWCKLLRRSFIESNQLYFKENIINEDAPWTFQLCLNAQRMTFVNEELYYYRDNPNSIMSFSKHQKIVDSNIVALQIFQDEIQKRPQLWNLFDIYIIYMRQVIIFYTLLIDFYSFRKISQTIDLLHKYTWVSPFFNICAPNIPKYYRTWNIALKLPRFFQPFYIWFIVKLQQHK